MTQLEASLRDFFFGLGRSSVTGQATVKNIEVPNIQFAFNAPILDIDEMFPSTGAAKEESGESGPVISSPAPNPTILPSEPTILWQGMKISMRFW